MQQDAEIQYSDDMMNKLTNGCDSINSHVFFLCAKKEEILVSICCILQERDFVLQRTNTEHVFYIFCSLLKKFDSDYSLGLLL
jgi:hypothetical protein